MRLFSARAQRTSALLSSRVITPFARFASLALLAAGGTLGCGGGEATPADKPTDKPTDKPEDKSPADKPADNATSIAVQAQAFRGRRRVSAPTSAYFADVNANGTGCPAGSWDAAIADDGETFTLRFSAYEASVIPGQVRDVKDCRIEIALGSTEGLSYSVASFFYQGYVSLDTEGMRARHTARYGFRRAGERNADRNEIAGPIDENYIYSGEVEPGSGSWSSCRREETLQVQTRLVVRNNAENSGSGYLNTSAIDGSLQLRWKLRWRKCRNPEKLSP